MLELIGKRLKKEGIGYHLLTGATSKEDRMRLAGEFQTDDVPVFLISLKAGGTGLNLTAADIVIHYDPWWNVAAPVSYTHLDVYKRQQQGFSGP